MTDPISDLLTRLRNATRSRKNVVHIPHSKLKMSICSVLKANGYIEEVQQIGEGAIQEIVVQLQDNRSDIHLKVVSKPGQRIYVRSSEIPRVLNGLGLAIVSTPRGVMSGKDARKQKLGGEYLCEVY